MDADASMGSDVDLGADPGGSADQGGDADGPKDLVRRGYDAVSLRYDEHYGSGTKYRPLLGELVRRVPAGGTVLDLGCGSGVPVARTLDAAGLRVTGVDISGVQVRRARQAVGLTVEREEFVPEGEGGHALFWAHRPLRTGTA